MKFAIKLLLTVILSVVILDKCSELPRSPLGDRITEGLKEYQKKYDKKCKETNQWLNTFLEQNVKIEN